MDKPDRSGDPGARPAEPGHPDARARPRAPLGHYVVPHWHIRAFRVAYWDKFARPAVAPKYALGFDTWWVDPAKEAALTRRKGEIPK